MTTKNDIRTGFDHAANTYNSVAEIQKRSAEFLANIPTDRTITSVLDIGCGTGYAALALLKRYPKAKFTLCDIAPNMLAAAVKHFPKPIQTLCCDAETYPFTQAYDLAVANLSLQWLEDLPGFVKKIKNCCRYFLFSTLLEHSFYRYKSLFENPPTFPYPTAQELLKQLPFDNQFFLQHYTLTFPNLFAVAKYFKKLGAHMRSNSYSRLKTPIASPIVLDFEVGFFLCASKTEK